MKEEEEEGYLGVFPMYQGVFFLYVYRGVYRVCIVSVSMCIRAYRGQLDTP